MNTITPMDAVLQVLRRSTLGAQFTGERYIPGTPGPIACEHLHRYMLACELVKNERVLDIACGEGYGTWMLSQFAQSAVGVDIDAATVAFARNKYGLEESAPAYHVGSCAEFPPAVKNCKADAIVSFETLEHHTTHDEFMGQCKSIMSERGFLLISSPNKALYQDVMHTDNHFHMKELYLHEFQELMRKHFTYVDFYGQAAMGNGTIIGHLGTLPAGPQGAHMYYLALASNDGMMPRLRQSYFELPPNV